MAIRQVIVPYTQGYDFGIGADLSSGSPMGQAVIGEVSGSPGRGATVDFQIQRISETHDLESALGIDVEASYGCAAFGAGVSARFNFAKKAKVQTSSLFMSITALVDLEFLQIDDPELSEDAKTIKTQVDLFNRRYGNMFVRGAIRGGLFVGVLRVDTGSSQESDSIAAEMEGSYGLFSAEAKVKFQQIQSRYRNEVFVRMYHEGGPVNLRITDPADPVQLLDNCNKFLDSFQANPDDVSRTYAVSLSPMDIARGSEPLDAAALQKAQDVIVMCAKRRSVCLDQWNLLDYINTYPSRFDFSNGADRAKIATTIDDLEFDLELVADCASLAMRDPAKATMPNVYAEEKGVEYPKAAIPDPLPVAVGARMITVPDFTLCASAHACKQMALPYRLNLQWKPIQEADTFQVLSIDPPKGGPIAEGGNVTLFYRPATSDLISGWIMERPPQVVLADFVQRQVVTDHIPHL